MRELVDRSLALLGPEHGTPLARAVGGWRIAVSIDAAAFRLLVVGDRLCTADPGPAELHVAASRHLVGRLLAGRIQLDKAIEHDLLHLQGPIDAILAGQDALTIWLHGALRSPRQAALLRELAWEP